MTVATVETIDTHTLGEPTRIVLSGFPELRGSSMKKRSRDLMRRHGSMRRALMWEPRGHLVMFGAVVVPPVTPGADLGLVFMDGGGVVDMCAHGTMGAVTALVETGRLKPRRAGLVVVDTPASAINVRVRRHGKRVASVELQGLPSRSVARGLTTQVGGRTVRYNLAYGGNLVAIVAGIDIGIRVQTDAFRDLVAAGMKVKTDAQAGWTKSRGRLGPWPEVVSALIYDQLGPRRFRDLVVFRNHSVDRSPCGSCVGALMAHLLGEHRIESGEWLECENLLGLAFRARLVERAGELTAELSGSAFVTGEHRFRIDSRDPLRHGFQLS